MNAKAHNYGHGGQCYRCGAFRARLAEDETECVSTADRIASLNAEVYHWHQQCNQRDAQITELEGQLADAGNDYCKLSIEHAELAKEHALQVSERRSLEVRNRELTEALAGERRSFDAQVAALQTHVAALQKRITELRGQVDDWRATCHDSDCLGSQWQERAQTAEAFLRRLTADDFDKTAVGEALWVEIREWLRAHGQG